MAKAGYLQYNPIFGDKAANLRRIHELISACPQADLLVLPELAATGYDFINREQAASLAEPFGRGETALLLRDLAAEKRMTLVAGYAERDGERVYNSCMLVTPSGQMHNYRKIHLFSRENELFDRGDAEPPVIETPVGRVGLMICYDWFFPEVARLLALKGAQILAHPSNLVLAFCQRAMFARCVENRVFAITANRIGTESIAGRTLTFTGASQVLDIEGNVLVSAPIDAEQVAFAEFDPSRADNKQVTAHNNLFTDRRVDLLQAIVAR